MLDQCWGHSRLPPRSNTWMARILPWLRRFAGGAFSGPGSRETRGFWGVSPLSLQLCRANFSLKAKCGMLETCWNLISHCVRSGVSSGLHVNLELHMAKSISCTTDGRTASCHVKSKAFRNGAMTRSTAIVGGASETTTLDTWTQNHGRITEDLNRYESEVFTTMDVEHIFTSDQCFGNVGVFPLTLIRSFQGCHLTQSIIQYKSADTKFYSIVCGLFIAVDLSFIRRNQHAEASIQVFFRTKLKFQSCRLVRTAIASGTFYVESVDYWHGFEVLASHRYWTVSCYWTVLLVHMIITSCRFGAYFRIKPLIWGNWLCCICHFVQCLSTSTTCTWAVPWCQTDPTMDP